MSLILVRLAEAADAALVADLIRDLEIHYGGADEASLIDQAHRMVERSMEEREGTSHALAFWKGRAVGLLCFAVLRLGFRTKELIFVKELFVREQTWGQTVGAAMMRWLAGYGRERGLGRIDLTTDAANTGAQAFYERLGALKVDKVVYRFLLEPGVLTQDEGTTS